PLPLPRRQAPVLLAAVEPDGAAGGLRAALLPALQRGRAVRHALGGGPCPLPVQHPARGLDPRGLHVRRAARDRRDGGDRRLVFPGFLHPPLPAAGGRRRRRRGLLLLHVLLGGAAAGADAHHGERQAHRGDDDAHGFGGGDGLGAAGSGGRADHHPRGDRHLVRPQPYRARLRAGTGL
ncbi:MAG: Glycerol ABC transporter, permease protein GlpQ, partial [uncultured Craurococcus sp.]